VRRQQRHAVRCWHCLTPIYELLQLEGVCYYGQAQQVLRSRSFPLAQARSISQ
jgi:hypothetical protein